MTKDESKVVNAIFKKVAGFSRAEAVAANRFFEVRCGECGKSGRGCSRCPVRGLKKEYLQGLGKLQAELDQKGKSRVIAEVVGKSAKETPKAR